MQRWKGGSFAPPLDDAKLSKYSALAETAEPRVKDAMIGLLRAVNVWWNLPESTGEGSPHDATPRATVVPLDQAHINTLDPVVPWPEELGLLSNGAGKGVFDSLPNGELRNAAFHLLWFAHELAMDREPITTDKLQ